MQPFNGYLMGINGEKSPEYPNYGKEYPNKEYLQRQFGRQSEKRYLCIQKNYIMKKVLIISTSLRSNSNSDALAQSFAQGAIEAGNEVEIVSLRNQTIQFCKGCLACTKTLRCVIKDDAQPIVDKMLLADVIVFATPIYYYEMSGQMKTLLDRANPLFNADYHFRTVYLLTAAAEDEPYTPDGAEHGLKGWIACFEKASFVETVFAGGVTAPNEIAGHPALQQAHEAGKNV